MLGFKSTVFLVLIAFILAWLWSKEMEFDPDTLKNKVVVICGASSGIGEEMAYQYAKYGARLVIAARRENRLKIVRQKCMELGSPETHYVVADFAKYEDAVKLHQETARLFGKLDTLILNHVAPNFGFWSDLNVTQQKLHQLLDINFLSYANLATLFHPELLSTGGNIGVVSSMSGIYGIAQAALYSANKFALHGFFDAYRVELQMKKVFNISITICILGPVATEMLIASLPPNSTDTYGFPISRVNDSAISIIKNVAWRKRLMYFPSYLKQFHYASFLFPDELDNFILANYRKRLEKNP